MKKIITFTTILGLLGFFASCSTDFNNPGAPGENTIRVELFCADPATKAAAAPVDGVGNENLINTIQYFFFEDEDSEPIYSAPFTPTDKTATSQLIEIDTEAQGVPTIEELFPGKKAIFFAIANYTGTENLSTKTLKQIKQIAIGKTYGTVEEMTGTTGTKYFVMTAEQEITPNVQTAQIPMKRIASKVSLTVNLNSVTTTDGDETTTWTPIWDVARGALERVATNALVGAGAAYTTGEGEEAQTDYYFPEDLGLFSPNDQLGEYTRFTSTANTQSFYTMPNRWEAGDDNEPDIKFILRWQMETKDASGAVTYHGISDERYYKIMLPGDLTSFDANCWYKLTASIGVNASEKEPVLTLDGFRVQAWNGPDDIVSADIKDAKYITPELSNVEFIGNSYTLSYYATGPVEVSNLSIYRVEYTNDGEGKLELITNNTANNTNINSLKDNEGAQLTENKVRAWESLNDGARTITINHPLCNDFTKSWFDALPYVYEVTLHLTGENTSYDKKVIIRQYPNFTLKQIESNGYVFVNNTDNHTGQFPYESNLDEHSKSITVGNRDIGSLVRYDDALINPNNKSGYMYLVSAAVSEDFSVLDPRNTTADQTVNNALSGLTGYKSTRSIDAVAPLFIIASSYGKTWQITYDNAKIRCAAYQESGYPAGRWRVPTEKEINFLITLRKNGYITELFYNPTTWSTGWGGNNGSGCGYWASSGNFYYYQGGEFRSGNNREEAVRCIYDAWYWGAEPLDNNGKKTTNANAATKWLTYEYANKISND